MPSSYVEFLDIDEVKGAAKKALEGYPPCPNCEGWVKVEEAQENDVLMKFQDTVGPYITVDYLCILLRRLSHTRFDL